MYRESKTLASAPALLLGQGPPYRGTVLLYHGLGSNKETQEKELYQLAERGFLAVGIDAVGHGERRYPHFEALMDSDDYHQEFLKMVRQTADEVPAVIEALRTCSGDLGNIGLAGISMGACVAYAAGLNQTQLSALVPILGSPDWSMGGRRPVSEKWWKDSPHLKPEGFRPLAMLMINAGLDQHVSPQAARDFEREALPYYRSTPERLVYKEYPESDHFMRAQDWEDLWQETLLWFEKYL